MSIDKGALGKAIGAAAAKAIGELGAHLPHVTWVGTADTSTVYVGGHAFAYDVAYDVAAALKAWAEFLGLADRGVDSNGCAKYGGKVAGVHIRLWGVVDEDAYSVRGGAR